MTQRRAISTARSDVGAGAKCMQFPPREDTVLASFLKETTLRWVLSLF
jgi:hypothetical protein